MGNNSRPGTVVVRSIDHDPFVIDGDTYLVRELHWNGIAGRSYDIHRRDDDVVFTEDESFDEYPTDEQIADALTAHGVMVEVTRCRFCDATALLATAHRHDGAWVGDRCCWDDRLRATE